MNVKFREFCQLCEKISTSDKKKKLELLQKFMKSFRAIQKEHPEQSFFPFIRFLVPQLDRARGAYGIKETSLAKLYVRVLCLPKDGADAQRLVTYRVPKTSCSSAKDFAEVAHNILKDRCSVSSDFTVESVNSVLDQLAALYSKKNTVDQSVLLLQPLVIKMSAIEQKWLIRIILKDLKLGIGSIPILEMYHPDAQELYDVTNDLEKVCSSLTDPNDRSFGIDISLFKPFRPMLADRALVAKILSKMGHKPFYVETKLDGERTQIHKNNERYSYFTRRGFDYTKNYGVSPSSGSFTPKIHARFQSHVQNCILDGEMIAWNAIGRFLVTKGENADVKNLGSGGTLVPAFFAFDILYLNDRILTGLPYKERLKLLESAVCTREGVFDFPSRTLVSSKCEVMDLLNKAIDQREEGLVLKDPDSIYKPNARRGGWLKMKPEYENSLMDHLDLIIIGGYYGQGKWTNFMSQFLLGVAVKADEGQVPTEFFSLVRVGSGYSQQELLALQQRLNCHWNKWDKASPPPMIHCTREIPDCWIEPNLSVILEVKASEVVVSDAYKVGLTLRFPRVERIRSDRAWYQTMTLSQVHTLRGAASGKLATRHYNLSRDQPLIKRQRMCKTMTGVVSNFVAADVSSVVPSTTYFKDKEICVYTGDSQTTKQQLETLIASASGTPVQHPGVKTMCIIADTMNVRVKSVKDQRDVVRPSWIRRCVDSGVLLPFRPEEMLVSSKSTAAQMALSFDEFGNCLLEPTAEEDVPIILNRVQQLMNPAPLSIAEIARLEFEIFGQVLKYGIFRTCTAYIDVWDHAGSHLENGVISSQLEITSLDFQFYGGAVVQWNDNLHVSHVIYDERLGVRVVEWKRKNALRQPKFHLVSAKWVEDSIAEGRMLNELAYTPR